MAELERLSHSSAHTYNECGERWRLERVERVDKVPWLAGPGGSAFHWATEQVDSGPCHDIETPWSSFEELLDLAIAEELDRPELADPRSFDRSVLADFRVSRKENYDWWLENGPRMVEAYRQWRLASGWKIWTSDFEPEWDAEGNISNGYMRGVELSFEVMLPSMTVPDKGYIDRIYVLPDGRIILIDLKTWGRERETTQLPHYYTVAKEHLGIPVDGVGYYDARLGRPTGLMYPTGNPDKPWDTDRLTGLLLPVERGIIGDVFEPKPGSQCGWCSVAHACAYKMEKK